MDIVTRDSWSTVAHNIVADNIENRQLAEELRLLYVAMTRARGELLLPPPSTSTAAAKIGTPGTLTPTSLCRPSCSVLLPPPWIGSDPPGWPSRFQPFISPNRRLPLCPLSSLHPDCHFAVPVPP